MKKNLTKIENKIYHYKDGVRMEGTHKDITGNVSSIRGDVSDIRGDVSGIRGDVSYIRGNLDDCEITEEERQNGIDISELVK